MMPRYRVEMNVWRAGVSALAVATLDAETPAEACQAAAESIRRERGLAPGALSLRQVIVERRRQ